MSKSTIKIMLVFTTICQFCLCVQTSVSGTYEGSITQSKNTSTLLTHKQVSQPIHEDLSDLIKFYQEAISKVNLDEAIPTVLEELSKKGYNLKPVTRSNTVRMGTRKYNTGVHTKAYRFASPDGNLWLDVIRFRNKASGKELIGEIKKNHNPCCSSESPSYYIYHTWNKSENSDVGAIFLKSDWLINIGITLPMAVPVELLGIGKAKLSQTEHQRILQNLREGIDSLHQIARLVVHNFVSDEDLAIIPTPVFSAPEFLTAEQISAKVTVSKSCSLDTDMELTLTEGESVKFNVDDNAHGFEELIMYRSGLIIHMLFFDNNGTLLSRGGSDFRHVEGALRQVGWLPYLIIAAWDVKEDKVIVKFRISSDKDRNQREYEKFEARKIRMSLQIRNRSEVLPPIQLTEVERLAGFARLWSEVKYNFAFFGQVPDLDWDTVLEEYLPKVQQTESVEQYYRVLRQCVALLQDGHTSVWGPSGEPTWRPPLQIRAVDGKAVIVEIFPAEKIKKPELREEQLKADLKLGEEVTHVDGRAVQEILADDLYPYICASTQQGRDLKAYPEIARGEFGTKAVLGIRGMAGAQREVTLTRGHYRSQHKPTGFVFRELGDGIIYINLPSFGSKGIVEEFDTVFNKISRAKGLILDVRDNGGGNSAFGDAIISYLTDKPLEAIRWKTRQYMPAFRAWGRQEDKWYEGSHDMIMPRKEGSFTSPLVVLTGPATFSAAEDFVVGLHASGRATVVGEKTSGSTGQPLIINLPGGGARICTKWDTYPDGREFVGVGVIPDVEVHPTPKDIAAERDVVLEKGLEVLRSLI